MKTADVEKKIDGCRSQLIKNRAAQQQYRRELKALRIKIRDFEGMENYLAGQIDALELLKKELIREEAEKIAAAQKRKIASAQKQKEKRPK